MQKKWCLFSVPVSIGEHSSQEKWARREDKERGEFDKRPMKKRNADYSDAESSGDDHPKKKSRDASGSSKAGLGSNLNYFGLFLFFFRREVCRRFVPFGRGWG